MEPMESKIRESLKAFRAGNEESAFFALIELDGDVLPALTEVFRQEADSHVRAFLVKAAWERRDEAVIPFLIDVLNGAEEASWQQALDGLVAFASSETHQILIAARTREFDDASLTKRFRLWLEEAIQQVELELRAKR